jgi:formate hydrogenlyase transcriptional activator
MTTELPNVASLVTSPERLDDLIGRALTLLMDVIPHELAVFLEQHDQELRVRVARGTLVTDQLWEHRLDLRDHPRLRTALETRRTLVFSADEHEHGEGDPYRDVISMAHGHSCMVVPVFAAQRSFGLLSFDSRACGLYTPEIIQLASVYGQFIGLAMSSALLAQHLEQARHQLEEHNRMLLAEISRESEESKQLSYTTRSPAMQQVVMFAKRAAATSVPVLLLGETGTGKEVLARAIHEWSPRSGKTFVKVNCAALPMTLIESELFGHVKGAFSGAAKDRPGRFLVANGGTLLLDEIGDLPLEIQAKLLRVLQEGTFQAVGSDQTQQVDVRILAATHVNLEQAVQQGKFREDLYYRLQVFPLHVPALRERQEDLIPLIHHILERLEVRYHRPKTRLSAASMERLLAYSWPGNIRELLNILERSLILSTNNELEVHGDLAPRDPAEFPTAALPSQTPLSRWLPSNQEPWPTLEQMERQFLEQSMAKTQGKIYGENGAAQLLDVPPSTLQSKLQRLGIKKAPKISE